MPEQRTERRQTTHSVSDQPESVPSEPVEVRNALSADRATIVGGFGSASPLTHLALLALLAVLVFPRIDYGALPYSATWFAISTCVLFFLSIFFPFGSFVALGMTICLAPMLGRGIMTFMVLTWLTGIVLASALRLPELVQLRPIRSPGAQLGFLGVLLFFAAMLGAAMQTVIRDFDPLFFESVFVARGLSGLNELATAIPISWYDALTTVVDWIVTLIFFERLLWLAGFARGHRASEQDITSRVTEYAILGLAVGAFVASIVAALQVARIEPFVAVNTGPFWLSLGRFSASFSDPNAFGVMAALLIPILAFENGRLNPISKIAAVSLCIASLFSGSRTLWLGLGVWVWTLIFSSRRLDRRWMLATGLLLGAVIVCIGMPAINETLRKVVPGVGAERVLRTLHWNEAGEMLYSRALFASLAWHIFTAAPFFGVGIGRFRVDHPQVAESLGIQLGGWRDNANNFYLQVLAEQGVLGTLAVLAAILIVGRGLLSPVTQNLERAEQRDSDSRGRMRWSGLVLFRAALVVLLVMLLTGPHLIFEDVRYLTLLVLVFALRYADGPVSHLARYKKCILTAVVLLPVVCGIVGFVQKRGDRPLGFYRIEHSPEGTIAWTVKRAELSLCSWNVGNEQIAIRALHPDMGVTPVRVVVSGYGKHAGGTGPFSIGELELRSGEWRQLKIPESVLVSAVPPLRLSFEVDRLWSPSDTGRSEDSRLLGVMIRWPSGACNSTIG